MIEEWMITETTGLMIEKDPAHELFEVLLFVEYSDGHRYCSDMYLSPEEFIKAGKIVEAWLKEQEKEKD